MKLTVQDNPAITFQSTIRDKDVFLVVDSDTDGTGVRIIAEHYFPHLVKSYKIVHSRTSTCDEDLKKYTIDKEIVIFADLVPSFEKYQELRKNHTVLIVDHHQTTRDTYGEQPLYFFDLERCSTKIFYDLISEGTRIHPGVRDYAELVDVYDRFQAKHPKFIDAKGLNYLLQHYAAKYRVSSDIFNEKNRMKGYTEYVEHQLKKFNKFVPFFFRDNEQVIVDTELEKETEEYEKAMEKATERVDDSGNSYIYFEASRRLSMIGNRVLESKPHIKYIVAHSKFLDNSTDDRKISLRCRDDFSVLPIAEKHGGGGHKKAAGFVIKDLEMYEALKAGEIHLI